MGQSQNVQGRRLGAFSFWVAVPLTALLLAFFSELIFQSRSLAFRDASHFYYPLYERLGTAFTIGKPPLWDPCENLGQPLLANPTSAFFYPGKLIFLLPAAINVSYGFCFKWYILAHSALAFFAFYRLARKFGSRSAAVFGAISYAFGGTVLFQQTNVIFLVGAAWLPLIVFFGIRLFETVQTRYALWLAFALAMTVFGGDPQTAYLAGVALAILFLCCGCRACDAVREGDTASPPTFRRRFALLLFAGFFATALAAVQILPSMEMASRSNRVGETPMSVWEIPFIKPQADGSDESSASLIQRWRDGFFCRQIGQTGRTNRLYLFSLPVYRCAEFLWPNAGGAIYPENSRWISGLPNGRYEWSATVYFGIFPLWAALLAMKFFRCRERNAEKTFYRSFFTWFALIGLFGAFGGFGLGWLVRFVAAGGDLSAVDAFKSGDPVGGVYWLLTQILPGFAAFRYPAKLMTTAMLGFSLLAVLGFDPLIDRLRLGRGRFSLLCKALFVVSGVLAIWFFSDAGENWLIQYLGESRLQANAYGPLDLSRAARMMALSFFQVACLFALPWTVFKLRFFRRENKRHLKIALIVILCLDLFAAQRWIVSTFPDRLFARPILTAIQSAAAPNAIEANQPPVRFYRAPNLAASDFLAHGSKNRPAELVGWQKATLLGQFAHQANCANLAASGTMTPDDFAPLKHKIWETDLRGELDGAWQKRLAFLDCRFLIRPDKKTLGPTKTGSELDVLTPSPDDSAPMPNGVTLKKLANAPKRARIFHRDFIDSSWEEALDERMDEKPLDGEGARILRYEPEYLLIEATLREPGYLLLCEQFWPGWRAVVTAIADQKADESQARHVEIKKDCFCMRRVDIGTGTWRIEMRYQPTLLIYGAFISVLGWLALAVGLLISRKKRRQTMPCAFSQARISGSR